MKKFNNNNHIIILLLLLIIIGLLYYILFYKKFEYFDSTPIDDKIVDKTRFFEGPKNPSDDDCKRWAENGECTTNWQYMYDNCDKNCDHSIQDIENHYKKCDKDKENGYCKNDKKKKYMESQCPDTC